MSAIAGTRRSMKELADGTIRVSIDIDPIHRTSFFEMFSAIDMPVALAPLVADFERIEEKPKGGELAKWAGIMCADPEFWEFANYKYFGEIHDLKQAAEWMRKYFRIDSRADLDHTPAIAELFRKMMRDFTDWKAA